MMIPKRKNRTADTRLSSAGFTLIEAMIALVVLAFGTLGLAAMMTDGIAYMNMSQADFIAQQKAEQAVESIFYARDSKTYSWAQLQNVGNGAGVFLVAPEVLCDPGPDGVVDTIDDNVNNVDVIYAPGPNGILTDPVNSIKMALSSYTRTIQITNVPGLDPNIRQIKVTINYTAGRFKRSYTLISYMSRFS